MKLIGSRYNGNFLDAIELIAEFDPFLAKHVEEFGNQGRGNPSYLSSTIHEEVIQIMAKKVRAHIVAEVTASKHFSVSVDSTPDLTHVDQLTTIIRYVVYGKAVERFLIFHQMICHKAEAIATTLLEYLERETIIFQDCRGQSYDNASNMSRKYSGMQARLKEVNLLALYIPCAGHSLNLVGTAAASCCVEVISLFGFIQKIYTFFSASTYRGAILTTCLKERGGGLIVKALSGTRWSARADATRALVEGYQVIREALNKIGDHMEQNPDTRNEAQALVDTMDHLETAFFCDMWNAMLARFNATNKTIQAANVDLKTVVDLITSLTTFIETLWDQFDEFEKRAQEVTGTHDYKACRIRKRSRRNDNIGASAETVLSARDNFYRETFLVTIDKILVSLKERGTSYQSVYTRSSRLSLTHAT